METLHDRRRKRINRERKDHWLERQTPENLLKLRKLHAVRMATTKRAANKTTIEEKYPNIFIIDDDDYNNNNNNNNNNSSNSDNKCENIIETINLIEDEEEDSSALPASSSSSSSLLLAPLPLSQQQQQQQHEQQETRDERKKRLNRERKRRWKLRQTPETLRMMKLRDAQRMAKKRAEANQKRLIQKMEGSINIYCDQDDDEYDDDNGDGGGLLSKELNHNYNKKIHLYNTFLLFASLGLDIDDKSNFRFS